MSCGSASVRCLRGATHARGQGVREPIYAGCWTGSFTACDREFSGTGCHASSALTLPSMVGFSASQRNGVLREIWGALVRECEELGGVCWEWQAADGVMGKSRFEGDARGPNPTDRAKAGTKKHVIVEQHGGPLGVVIAGANINDHKLLGATIDAIVVERPDPKDVLQHLCLDKAYDNKATEAICAQAGYTAHVRRIGEEKLDSSHKKTYPARRWVVERTIAWLQRCRAILIRYDKKATNYEGLIQLACTLIWHRRLHRLNHPNPVPG
jgi:putative transposase